MPSRGKVIRFPTKRQRQMVIHPQNSKLRPSPDEPEFVEFADVPRYCIHVPGRPPIFTDEPPSANDKSALLNPTAFRRVRAR